MDVPGGHPSRGTAGTAGTAGGATTDRSKEWLDTNGCSLKSPGPSQGSLDGFHCSLPVLCNKEVCRNLAESAVITARWAMFHEYVISNPNHVLPVPSPE